MSGRLLLREGRDRISGKNRYEIIRQEGDRSTLLVCGSLRTCRRFLLWKRLQEIWIEEDRVGTEPTLEDAGRELRVQTKRARRHPGQMELFGSMFGASVECERHALRFSNEPAPD